MKVSFVDKEKLLISEYDKLKPKLTIWGDIVRLEIERLLNNSDDFETSKLQILSNPRLKPDNSLIARVFYRGFVSSGTPLKRIEDKIGLRIVVTTLKDLDDVKKIIENSTNKLWTTRVSRSLSKSLNTPKEFDYQSLHINLTPTQENKDFQGLSKKKIEFYVCEVQVRTLLQHAFAEVAHDTIYKGAFTSSNSLVRLMSRSMALMEVTDEMFGQVFEKMNKKETIENSFISKLMEISDKELEHQFDKKDYDDILTNDFFAKFYNKDKYSITDITRIIIANKSEMQGLLRNLKSYLGKQPIIIFIAYFILSNCGWKIKDQWFLEEDILKEVFQKLGYSFGK